MSCSRYWPLVVCLALLMVACTSTPSTVQSYSRLKQQAQQAKVSDVESSVHKNQTVVIYIYPENGPVSMGRYYRLPVRQDKIHSNIIEEH